MLWLCMPCILHALHKKSKACVPLRVTHPHFDRTFDCFAIDAFVPNPHILCGFACLAKKSKTCVPLRVTHPHFVRTFDCFAIDAELGYKDSNLEMTESESVTVGNASSVFISVPGLFISECYH